MSDLSGLSPEPSNSFGSEEDLTLNAQQFALAQFALTEAVRALNEQSNDYERVLTRSLTQLAFGAAVSTFLLREVLQPDVRHDGEFFTFVVLITVLGVATAWATLGVRSTVDWDSAVSALTILNSYVPDPSYEKLKELASFYDKAWDNNEAELRRCRRSMLVATIALGVLLVVLVLALWRLT